MFTYQQDWIMRQIQVLVDIVGRLVFNGQAEYRIADPDQLSQTDLLYDELGSMIRQGTIGMAENRLFEQLQTDNQNYLLLAVDFYQKLNQLTDDELARADFSREEIQQGLQEVMEMYGLPGIPE